MKLRDYQRTASDSVVAEWREAQSTLVVLPTGCGKTVLFADIIRRIFPRRALVLAHREELIFQAQDKIQRVTGLKSAIEMADYRADLHGNLFDRPAAVISTIQTQTAGGDGLGRMSRFSPDDFGALIIDEAHHACAGSYRRCIDYYRQNTDLRVLGVTATPDRADEEALGQVFETVAFDYEILDAIHDGWLVPIEQQMVEVSGLDFSSIRTTAGDLNGADLAAVMEAEENLHRIASPALEIIGNRKALGFAASVAHAERLAEIFNRHKPNMASWVCGKTDKDKRREILQQFAQGQIQVVWNCGVLTEGFDDPSVEIIIMGRPTKSRSLYSQMVGRSTRPLPGIVDGPETPDERKAAIAASSKPTCLVVDFVGNSGKHKLMTSADILGGNVSEEAIAAAVLKARKAGKPVRMSEALDDEEQAIKQRQAEEAARRARLRVGAKWSTRAVNPFDVLALEPAVERGWDRGKHLTEKQRALLVKQGIDPDSINFAQGRQIINELFRRWNGDLCTFGQAKVLKRFGYDTTEIKRADASTLIDRIKANGWRRPAEVAA